MALRDAEMLVEEIRDLSNYQQYNLGNVYNAMHYMRQVISQLEVLSRRERII